VETAGANRCDIALAVGDSAEARDSIATRTHAIAGVRPWRFWIGALLRIPLDRVYERLLEALHDHGFTDINESHFKVLRWPGPNGDRPVELAKRAGMTRQAMNYLLGQLEDLGYVERRADPNDVRSRRVHLTPHGRSTIAVIRDAVSDLEREWETQLGAGDWQQLKRLLVRLNDAALEEPAS
jgi:DNA-binding MarR family transcriptional regulator